VCCSACMQVCYRNTKYNIQNSAGDKIRGSRQNKLQPKNKQFHACGIFL
jgi:hypothetical protein